MDLIDMLPSNLGRVMKRTANALSVPYGGMVTSMLHLACAFSPTTFVASPGGGQIALDLFIANRNAGEFEIDINTLPQMPSKLPHGLKPFSFATAVVAAVSPATMSIEPTGTSTSGFTANLDMTASDDTITAPGAAGQDDMERPQLKKSRLNETAAEASVNV
jgi:hypothetical protein